MSPTLSTVCAMMRNEERYIPEWVAYHRAIGFDEIFIIDNESTDSSPDILHKLKEAGLINSIFWKSDGRANQRNAYSFFLRQHARTEWVSFLDADEFLVLHRAETVADFLSEFPPDVSQVCLNWRIFGSSGLDYYEPSPTFTRFTKAASIELKANRHLKYFARVSEIEVPHVHSAIVKSGRTVNPECAISSSRPSAHPIHPTKLHRSTII